MRFLEAIINTLKIGQPNMELKMITINKIIFFTTIFLATVSTSFSQAADQASTQSATAPKSKNKFNTTMTLNDVANYVERGLKAKIIVGRNYADKEVLINLSKGSLSYDQLLTQLNINGFTAYRSKDYIQIVATRDARQYSIPVAEEGKTYLNDEYVTDFLKTEKSCTLKVLGLLRPLVPQYGHLSSYRNAHTILIVDTYSNIQRIKLAIKKLKII
ncbi:MAG: hypothetical protein V4732_22115 [Pseudomonadota bacterium]